MHRQGDDLQLTQYDERGWRATCFAIVSSESELAKYRDLPGLFYRQNCQSRCRFVVPRLKHRARI